MSQKIQGILQKQIDVHSGQSTNVSNVILLIGTAVSVAWSLYFAYITIITPYQIELREGTSLVMTQSLLNGRNPFSLESHPLGMNNYGLGYSSAVWPFALLFGNTLLVHRSITLVFILATCLLVAGTVYRFQKNLVYGIAYSAFIMVGLMGRGGIGAFPSAMGVFLFLAAALIPFNRSFDYPSLLASIFLSLMAFYTKPYFVVAFGITLTYTILFVSKKKGLVYGLLFSGALLASTILVRYIFPMYFIDTIISNFSNTHRSFSHLYAQIVGLFKQFFPSIILGLYFLAASIVAQKRKWRGWESLRNLEPGSFDRPFIPRPLNYFGFFFIFSTLIFVFVLGPHIGNYLLYAYQIVVPPFFCWLFYLLGKQNKYVVPIVLVLAVNLLGWNFELLKPTYLEQRKSPEWTAVYQDIAGADRVLNSPEVASQMIELGKPLIDSGQTNYFYEIAPFATNKLIGPSYAELTIDGMEYKQSIHRSIRNQDFDLILLNLDKESFYHSRLVPNYYRLRETLSLDMPQSNEQWTIEVWERR